MHVNDMTVWWSCLTSTLGRTVHVRFLPVGSVTLRQRKSMDCTRIRDCNKKINYHNQWTNIEQSRRKCLRKTRNVKCLSMKTAVIWVKSYFKRNRKYLYLKLYNVNLISIQIKTEITFFNRSFLCGHNCIPIAKKYCFNKLK